MDKQTIGQNNKGTERHNNKCTSAQPDDSTNRHETILIYENLVTEEKFFKTKTFGFTICGHFCRGESFF